MITMVMSVLYGIGLYFTYYDTDDFEKNFSNRRRFREAREMAERRKVQEEEQEVELQRQFSAPTQTEVIRRAKKGHVD